MSTNQGLMPPLVNFAGAPGFRATWTSCVRDSAKRVTDKDICKRENHDSIHHHSRFFGRFLDGVRGNAPGHAAKSDLLGGLIGEVEVKGV